MGVNDTVAVVDVAFTVDASVIERALIPLTTGNLPVIVASMTTTVGLLKSFDVPAATLVSCICPLVGVVNFVTVSVTEVREA